MHIFRASFVVALLLVAGPARGQESQLPDDDSTNRNNSFDTAIDLGLLVQPGTSVPTSRTQSGELGQVLTGYDTQDVYKFTLPANEYEVTLTTTEDPPTTSWLSVYDANRTEIARSIDNPGERIALRGTGGPYYAIVRTGIADGRRFGYTLTVGAIIKPLPNMAGSSCQGYPQVLNNGREWSGSLANPIWQRGLPVYLPYPSEVVFGRMLYPRDYEIFIDSRVDGASFLQARHGGDQAGVIWRMLDPGFYCVVIKALPRAQPINFKFKVGAPQQAGFPMRAERANAPMITKLDLGNLSRNGYYKGSRYTPEAQRSDVRRALVPGHFYVLREWIGEPLSENWFLLELSVPSLLEADLDHLYNRVRLELHDQGGVVVAFGATDSTPLTDRLPPVKLRRALPVGIYYLRLVYEGPRTPGTSYQLTVRALQQ